MRSGKVHYENVRIIDLVRLEKIEGRRIDMELHIRPENKEELFRKFAVRFAQDEIYHTAISFRPHESIVKVDRKFSGSRRALIHQRRSLVRTKDGELKLRIILDRFSAEVFINDGEQVMTITFYTPQTAKGISFYADGTALLDVVKYDLI